MNTLKLFLIGLGVMIEIAFIIGFVGDSRVEKGINDLVQATIGNALNLFQEVEGINQRLQNLPPFPNFESAPNVNPDLNFSQSLGPFLSVTFCFFFLFFYFLTSL